jgi:4a-hydroxytetrahydrobiopterin dehydratase
MTDLADQHCAPCEGDTNPLTGDAARQRAAQLSERWQVVDEQKIVAEFKFKNYCRTQAFVNAVAYIAHREGHHPDISFGYNQCTIALTTHAIGGLSDNDFISAAKVDRLLD